MEMQLIQETLLTFEPKASLCFISNGIVLSIPINEITHLSNYGNETVIYTVPRNFPKGKTLQRIALSYKTPYSLQEIMNDLPVNDFFRVHDSHIVSLRYMDKVQRGRIAIGKYLVPMSRHYKVEMMERLRKRLDEEVGFYEMMRLPRVKLASIDIVDGFL